MDRRVARRYARALFLTALNQGQVRLIGEELDQIAILLQSDAQLQALLYSPLVPDERKTAILEQLFAQSVQPATFRLLALLVQKDREKLFGVVREEYHRLREEQEGILRATIYTAVLLDDLQKEALRRKLEELTGKQVIATFEIEPELIGGVRVVMGDYQIEGSVKGALEQLRDTVLTQIAKRQVR